MHHHVEVLIIGSGAGGSPLALRLSELGFRVLVLEKGPRYRRDDYVHDEVLMSTADMFTPPIDQDPHVLLRAGSDTPELTDLGWIASCVGGGTEHMGAALYRFHPGDFALKTRLGAYEAVEDWPYGYDDIEPYYTAAEWQLGVSGDDPPSAHTGWRSQPYPMRALGTHAAGAAFDRACRHLGLHPFGTPMAVNSRPYQGRPPCAGCHFCAGYGCPTGARGSAQAALLPRAEATGRCEVRPNAMVTTITVDDRDVATGCVYVDADGVEHAVTADVVCVSCSAVESARLLLLSSSPRFPAGLANRSGLVGRHLQFHANSCGTARFVGADAWLQSSARLGRSFIDHYFLPDGVSPFPKGGVHQFERFRPAPIRAAQQLALPAGRRPIWGEPLMRLLHQSQNDVYEIAFEVLHDFVPNARTFVSIDPDVRDRWGLPVARIHLDEPAHHQIAGQWLAERALEVLFEMGAVDGTVDEAGRTSRVMTHGTCRAGHDRETSVVNGFCQTHDVRNLFVVDGSFMPTSGGSPSTLTIVANSLRVADFVADAARRGDL
jgi:choline dehydrogenase-like flavoprotein